MNINSKNINKLLDFSGINFIRLIILCFIISIIPIIVKVLIFNNAYIDFFSYYKSRYILFSSILLLTLNIYSVITDKLYLNWNFKRFIKNPVNLLISLFLIGVTLSTIFSDFIDIALTGANEKYESIFIIYSYIIIFYNVLSFVKNEYTSKLIILFSMISATIIGIISFGQFLGLDLFTTQLGARLISGKDYVAGSTFTGVFEYAYGTLYNPNILSQYSALIFPISFVMGVALPFKNKLKYIFILNSILIFISLIASGSSTGIAGVMASFVFGIIIFLIYLFRENSKKFFILLTTICVLFFFGIIIYLVPYYNSQIKTFFKTELTLSSYEYNYSLKEYSVKDNSVFINIFNQNLEIVYSKTDLEFMLYQNNEFIKPTEVNDNSIVYEDLPHLGNVYIEYRDDIFIIQIDKYSFRQRINSDSTIIIINSLYEDIENEKIPYIDLKGNEKFGSARGYIWSRSIPLIFDNIFIGTGADTFSSVFPQNDFKGKIEFLGNHGILVDKAHNFYLQTAIENGLISAISIILLFIYYIINSAKSIFKKVSSNYFIITLKFALLIGIVGCMTSFMFTDSTVQVAPVFWSLLALGFSVNKFNDIS